MEEARNVPLHAGPGPRADETAGLTESAWPVVLVCVVWVVCVAWVVWVVWVVCGAVAGAPLPLLARLLLSLLWALADTRTARPTPGNCAGSCCGSAWS